MKKSTLKTGLLVSIVFLAIIAIIIVVYENKIDGYEKRSEKMVVRIEAKTDIVPGTTITEDLVRKVQVQDVLKTDGLLYKLKNNEAVDEEGKQTSDLAILSDGRWALDKVATQKIYAGEFLTASKLALQEDYYDDNERLYAIPFDAASTGGFNVEKGESVDIAVRYKTDINVNDVKLNNTIRTIYQSLKPNQITDVVLAKRVVEDIRDETGTSISENAATKPGFICFRLTYEQINKLEWAKECGSLYIGKSKNYSQEPYSETFMAGMELPAIGLQSDLPSQQQPQQ